MPCWCFVLVLPHCSLCNCNGHIFNWNRYKILSGELYFLYYHFLSQFFAHGVACHLSIAFRKVSIFNVTIHLSIANYLCCIYRQSKCSIMLPRLKQWLPLNYAFQFVKDEAQLEDDIPYRYEIFHFVFSMGAMYFAMLFISWELDHPTRK